MNLKYNSNVASIVYASDDRFSEILGVSLVSLYDNSKDLEDIKVYVLDSGISEENKNKLNSIPLEYGRSSICYIKAENINDVLKIDVNTDRGSLSQYARLFISKSLPLNIGRILYLDCDIIINSTISELWNIDMCGKTIAALKDAFSKYYRKNIDLESNDIMFNSGVMLIDLELWKYKDIENKLLEFIKKHNGKIQQGDQGALNAILTNDIYCFHPKFNSVTIFYDFSYDEMLVYRKPVDFYSREEIIESVNHPVIIHYTTSFLSVRPWYQGCSHYYSGKWIEYKNKSPWKNSDLWQLNKKKGVTGIYISLMNILPRKISVWISGLLQAYGRPWLNTIKNMLHE